jgi:hypothetical protein
MPIAKAMATMGIVGRAMFYRATSGQAIDAMRPALLDRKPPQGLISERPVRKNWERSD